MASARYLISSIVVGLLLVLASPYITVDHLANKLHLNRASGRVSSLLSRPSRSYSTQAFAPPAGNMERTPVYFLSHGKGPNPFNIHLAIILTFTTGGPNLFEDYKHPAYSKLQTIGREITTQIKPKAVIVISAHWQGSTPDTIEVNTSPSQNLIYDYYGFPAHYYKVQYPNTGSSELASKILSTLKTTGIKAEGVSRGLDHGVFSPFLVAFDPEKNPLNVPIVQVSLFASDSASQHLALGKALAPFRDQGVAIICSGMAVHNLRDLRSVMMNPAAGPKGYAISFDEALREAVENEPGEGRDRAMEGLLGRKDARLAHPTFEHLLPVHVAAGAAGGDAGKRLWTLPEGSMSWAQFRFGEVEAAS